MVCTYVLYVNDVECVRCYDKKILMDCIKMRGLTIDSDNVRIEVEY